jgi:hypothetical protein
MVAASNIILQALNSLFLKKQKRADSAWAPAVARLIDNPDKENALKIPLNI